MRSDILQVSGARLYYEARGSGQVLMMIHAGGASARTLQPLAEWLRARHTVITYDRRGLSRSRLDDPAQQQHVETHGDDAHRLLALFGDRQACVFGSSGGAVIALELAIRHPDLVRAVVAHEPPAGYLLDDAPSRPDTVLRIYQERGLDAAMQVLLARQGLAQEATGRASDQRPKPAALRRDRIFMFEQELPMYARYRLDLRDLRVAARTTRITFAGGVQSRRHVGHRSAAALVGLLGGRLAEFPGGHAGYLSEPQAFAARLEQILSD